MKRRILVGLAILAISGCPAIAQQSSESEIGEVVVTANRLNGKYAKENRPVIGLRRQADSAAMQVAVSSDARELETRKREIYAVLGSAIDRAPAAGIELVTGNFELMPVTKANFTELPFIGAGRVDTSQVILMIKVKLSGSSAAAEQRLKAFIKSVLGSGRGGIEKSGDVTLTIINPDQYRDAIVRQVAETARQQAAIFGPDYAVQVSGIDGQVFWSQISSTDVFLYVPYRYTIVPK